MKRRRVGDGSSGSRVQVPSGRSYLDTLLELPPKRQRIAKANPNPHDPLRRRSTDPIKVMKACFFSHHLKSKHDLDEALDDAREYEDDNDEGEDREPVLHDSRSGVVRAGMKLDVLSSLLDRRDFHADRIHDTILAINVFTDASPNTGLEFQGMVADIFKKDASYRRIVLPGCSLIYGMQDAVNKTITLLWAIWLLTGPVIEDTAYFLQKVCCITTDAGIEILTTKMPCVLNAFAKWLNGTPLVNLRCEVNWRQRLFPHAIRLIGWSHTWGNIMKQVAFTYPGWGGCRITHARATCFLEEEIQHR